MEHALRRTCAGIGTADSRHKLPRVAGAACKRRGEEGLLTVQFDLGVVREEFARRNAPW